MSTEYEILAVRYGHFERRSHENFYGGDSHDIHMPLDYFMDRGKPFPVFDTLADVLNGVERMRKLASSPQHIVPGHDPLVLERYPSAHSDLPGVVRLDLTPLV